MPPTPSHLLLKAALALGLLASASAGAQVPSAQNWGDRAPDEARVERLLQTLSNREKVGQLLMAYPQVDRQGPVEVGGVLFVGNALRRLDLAKERISSTRARARIPPFFAVDIEGGSFNRLRSHRSLQKVPLAKEMAALSDKEVEAWGQKVALAMREVGLNMNLAPVFDVAASGHMSRNGRAFSGDPEVVKRKASAFAKGLASGNVVPVGKHFPGYGDLDADSDHVQAVADWALERLWREAAIFDASSKWLGGVMLSNIVYRKVGDKPAILVPEIVALARTRPWLTLTDDLSIKALADQIGAGSDEVLRQAFLAGNDLLLTTAPPDWDKGLDYFGILLSLVESDPSHQERLDAACRRVLRLKDRMGLLEGL